MLRAAVERQCEIIGEALAKLAKADDPVATRISEYRRIIAFRNHLSLLKGRSITVCGGTVTSFGDLVRELPADAVASPRRNELATIKLRYKAPDGDTSQLISVVLRNEARPLSANLGFASAVAEFGMLLRQSKHAGTGTFESAVADARRFRGEAPEGNRAEFVKLVELAASLRRMHTTQ